MTAVQRLVANGNSIINFLKEFSSATAKDVSVDWVNDDGTVDTKTFANIKKFQDSVNAVGDIGGEGYTWVDETANRAIGVTYTNNTGKPIMIMACLNVLNEGASSNMLYIDGVLINHMQTTGSNIGYRNTTTAIIPSSSTYEIKTAYSSGLIAWFELKG